MPRPFFQAKLTALTELLQWTVWAKAEDTLEDEKAVITRFIDDVATQKGGHFVIRLKTEGTLIGIVSFKLQDAEIPAFTLGYWLATPYTGHGYMAEAVRALTSYLFAQKGAQRVAILCNAANLRSAAVARKAGFVQEGLLHNKRRLHGQLGDELIFAHTPETLAAFLTTTTLSSRLHK